MPGVKLAVTLILVRFNGFAIKAGSRAKFIGDVRYFLDVRNFHYAGYMMGGSVIEIDFERSAFLWCGFAEFYCLVLTVNEVCPFMVNAHQYEDCIH